MFSGKIWNCFSRLVSSHPLNIAVERKISIFSSPLFIKFTPCLFGEPLKKKKRLDPAILRAREERRKKKLEKQIRRLQKNARQLKPIDEIETSWALIDEKDLRTRSVPSLTNKQTEERALLLKEWTRFKNKQYLEDLQQMDKFICSQQKALDELRAESEDLYSEAIQIDPGLIPIKVKGPVKTPPIKNYESPDGEYIDISKKWI